MESTVFPVNVTHNAEKNKNEKRPAISNWQLSTMLLHEVTTDNYGINILPSWVVFDLDLYKNKSIKAELKLKTGFEITDSSLLQRTISGGEHHVFRYPSDDHELTQGANLFGIEGLDTRCAGRGWICSGEGYEHCVDHITRSICSDDAIDLPDNIFQQLIKRTQPAQSLNHEPIPEIRNRVDIEEVESALDCISADDRDTWVKVGMALQNVPSGLLIWDKWSQKSDKYNGGEIQYIWESFQGQGITVATVFGLAIENGWSRPNIFQDIESGDASDFAAMPDIPQADNDLFRELSKWAFLRHNDRFYQIDNGEMVSTSTFDLMLKNGFNFRVLNPITNREKTFLPREYFLAFCQDRVVHMPMYAPVFGSFFEFEGMKRVNSYLHDRVPSADPLWKEKGDWKVIQNHYLKLFENPEVGHKLLQWMAFNVQNTGHKILWAPIVCGVQGDGKSSIANILRACMGGTNVKEIGASDVKSSFNDWAEGAAVVAMEELRVKGHNRHDVMNALKPLISNPNVSINKKGIGRYESQNVTNYVAFTNYEDALVLDENDRRWEVFFSKYTKRDKMLSDFGNIYWEIFHAAYRDNPAVIRGWLLEYDISDFDPNVPPRVGDGNARMIEASKTEIEQAIDEIMLNTPDFFTISHLREQLISEYPYTNSVKLGKVLAANDKYEFCGVIKVASKTHKFWGKSDAVKRLKFSFKDERDFSKELNKAARQCFLEVSDHVPF